MKKAFGTLQQMGRALMLPVSVLPAAGLLLRFGDKDLLNNPVIKDAGGVLFSNLPLLFAAGVALGFAGGEGTAVVAAVVGYLVLNSVLTNMGPVLGLENVNGQPALNMGVFGGIIIGFVAALLYKRFHDIKLPPYLGFFAGKRFVPIVTSVSALLLGVAFAYIWQPIQHGIDIVAQWAMSNPIGPFAFGFGQRILIPFGLHHIFYQPFWFLFGSYTDPATGQVYHGDIARFFAGDPTAGKFMTGLFPIMLFGLPAAALAMIHTARPEKRKMVTGIMVSAALTSFLTGITEPVEFAFAFVAPILFVIHAIFTGLVFVVTDMLGIRLGFTFSAGFIDYVLNFGKATKPLWIIPVGLVTAVIYYVGFRFAIQRWNLATPGREPEAADEQASVAAADEKPRLVLEALGGKDNVQVLDACITRLRVTVRDVGLVNKERLKQLGATDVLTIGDNIQAIFGTQSDALKEQIKAVMNGREPAPAPVKPAPAQQPSQPAAGIPKSVEITSPLSGEVMPLEAVPDAVFSQKMMGDGFAVQPEEGSVFAPFDGEVMLVFPTRHAIGLKDDAGNEWLIHVGIDTVQMKGDGFEAHVKEGDRVRLGQLLLTFDLDKVKREAPSAITPVVLTNGTDKRVTLLQQGRVATNTPVLRVEHALHEKAKEEVLA